MFLRVDTLLREEVTGRLKFSLTKISESLLMITSNDSSIPSHFPSQYYSLLKISLAFLTIGRRPRYIMGQVPEQG